MYVNYVLIFKYRDVVVTHLKRPIADSKFFIFSSHDLPESIKTILYG